MGHDREYVGRPGFSPTSPPSASSRMTTGAQLPLDKLAHPAVVDTVKNGLAKMNAEGRGSSSWVKRNQQKTEPPQVDGQEITDKGYINSAPRWNAARRWSRSSMLRRGRDRDIQRGRVGDVRRPQPE